MGTGTIGILWRARTHRRRTAVVSLAGLAVVVGALFFPLSALANHNASDFFIFSKAAYGKFAEGVGAADCDGSNNATANVSGSSIDTFGRIHSNADWAASGSGIVFTNRVTFGTHGENCSRQDEAANNTYLDHAPEPEGSIEIDTDPPGVGTHGWPGDLGTYLNGDGLTFGNDITQVLGAGASCAPGTSLTGTTDITIDTLAEVAQYNGQVVCNGTGKVVVSLSAPSPPTKLEMSVTIVSHGAINISGQYLRLNPASHSILAWTDQDSNVTDVSITVAGSNFEVPDKAILFTPRSGQDVSGSDDSSLCIQAIGQGRVKVGGSNSDFGFGICEGPPPPEPALSVSKTPDNGTINAGTNAVFSITVTNTGTGSASNVTLTDNLPDGGLNWSVTGGATQPNGGTCSISGSPGSQVLSCNFGILDPNATRTVEVTSPTDIGDCATKNNTVNVSATGNLSAQDSGSITIQCPDVQVVKTPDAGVVNAGSNAVFGITVTNNGPGSAANVNLNDPLPNGGLDWSISAGASQPNGGTCSIAGPLGSEVLSCSFGTLAQGDTRTVQVSSPTLQGTGSCGVKDNTATITAAGDTNSQNNSDDGQITVNCPDISVVKTPDAGSVNAGSNAVFSITLTNNGPGSATAVTLTDNLPNGNLNWAITVNPGGCSISGGIGSQVLNCAFGTLTHGATRTVELTSPTTSASCGVKNNTATGAATNDNTPGNNSDQGQITVNCPDVSVVKLPDAGSVNAGSNAVFSITVTNNGPGSAANVNLNDALPNGGLDWSISAGATQPNGGTCSIAGPLGSEVLSCAFGTLAQGDTRTVEVTSPTLQGAGSCGVKNNTVTITATGDTNSQNNSDTGQITINCPDVSVSKTPDAGSVNAGSNAVFSITVTNNGPGPAANVNLNDPLPDSGLTWAISAGATQPNGGTCTITGVPPNQVLSCAFGTLAQGDTRTVEITSPTTSASCGVKNNTVTVSATGDVTPSNNTNAGQITVNCPDVSVVKSPDGETIQAGDPISFSIVVTNNGPGSAANVTLSDTLPGGFSWQLGGANAASCLPFDGTNLSCAFGTVAQGDSRTVTLTSETQAADCGTVVNTATISATGDTNSQNNSNQGSVTIQCPDVSVSKTPDAGTVDAGTDAVFSITVTNNGPGPAANVNLNDPLPDGGLNWSITSQPEGDPCQITGAVGSQVLTCAFGTLADHATRTVQITSPTLQGLGSCGPKSNTVTVSATGDVTPTNNTNDGQITVNCPDVSVEKDGNGTIDAGDVAEFTITITNNGPGSATGVTLNDDLPGSGWAIFSQTGTACSVDGSGSVLTCGGIELAEDGTYSVVVRKTTTAANCGTLPNTATVSAANEPAGEDENNSDDATITVECPDVVVEKTGNGTIDAGELAVFTITITNNGPGQATGVGLNDDLPGTGWEIDDQTGDACSLDGAGGILTCSGITLDAEESYEIVVEKLTTAANCGTLPNLVTVSAENEAEGDTENNSDEATITVECPDVTVEKTGNGTIAAGTVAEFTIVISNNGPGTATGVSLNDDLPGSGWTIFSQTEDNCSVDGTGSVLTCGGITLSDEDSYTIVVRKTTTAADCGQLPNLVTVSAENEAQGDTENNSDEATIVVECPTVTGQGALDVVKTASPTTVKEPGGLVTFSVTIRNTSNVPVTVDNVVDSVFGDLDDSGGNGCFDVPVNLNPGESVNCTFDRQITGAGGTTHVNVVTVDGHDGFGNQLKDTDDARVDITPRLIDLVIVKTATSPTPLNGIVNYSMTVTNKGPDTATNVQLADPAPTGITYLSANPSQGTCNVTASLITCSLGTINPGQTVTIAVTGRATLVGTHTNIATVTGGGGRETNPADNVDDAVTVVPAPLRPPSQPRPQPQPVCLTLTVSPKMIKADGKPDTVRVRVTAGAKRVRGTKVSIFGAGVRKTGRSNGQGMAVIRINPRRAGLITITAIETNQRVCGPKRIGVVGVFLPPLTG